MLRAQGSANKNITKTKSKPTQRGPNSVTLEANPARYDPFFRKQALDNVNCKPRYKNLQMFKRTCDHSIRYSSSSSKKKKHIKKILASRKYFKN